MPSELRVPRGFVSEIKFLVDPARAERIREWSRAHLAGDPYGEGAFGDEYRITSLHLDTDSFDVFHRRGSFARSSYRIRRYGHADSVFLERKMKRRDRLNKRRIAIPIEGLSLLVAADPVPGWEGFWFHRRLLARRLHPTCEVAYRRTARTLESAEGPVRVTIDEGLEARVADGVRFVMAPGLLALERQCVIEFKFRGALPARLRALVEEHALQVAPVSKYRLAIAALGLGGDGEAVSVAHRSDTSYA